MSNVTPIYAQAVPVSYTGATTWPWIIVIIILIIVIIGLTVWLIVKSNNSNNSNLVTMSGAAITSGSSSITGSWTTLSKDTDKVTLYVSTKPLVFDNKGVAINPTVSPSYNTGAGNAISVATGLTTGVIYNVALVATNANSNNYVIFGPKKVITQESANLKNILINIRDINNTLGSVSNTGKYTEIGQSTGIYKYDDSSKFLIKYNDGESSDAVLCRNNSTDNPASGTNVVLANYTDDPANITYSGTSIPVESCEWTYNDAPSDGTNQWCLHSSQPTNTTNSTVSQILCLSQNGNNLNVVTPSQATVWFNQKYSSM